ncbi:type VII secretion protein EssC [Metabacillus sp. KIGAM252]|uniref:Type VII secretion protein EssC n=1 Tax=Metabacillus flavus TaxID=2823519 RepID=A0ABS5LJM3_9BACI|nr:type VII secretion protein EssC [Metabacillus flavus]MBS2970806.1 type VII secretion protein EssC [Metabacillus flavus]
MSTLWVFYQRTYQPYSISDSTTRTLTIGPEYSDTLTVRSFPFSSGALELTREEGKSEFQIGINGEKKGSLAEKGSFVWEEEGHSLVLCLTPELQKARSLFTGYEHEILFSGEKGAQISSSSPTSDGSFRLIKQDQGWTLESASSRLYKNGHRIDGKTDIQIGDILLWGFMTITVVDDDIMAVSDLEEFKTTLTEARKPESEMKKKYPAYRRTPRMIYDLPDDKISLNMPLQETEDTNRGLWLIIMPPLVMLILMGIVALVQPRGIYIIITVAMFSMTLITSSVQYFKERSQRKKREERRVRVYKAYLERSRAELQELSQRQKTVLRYHFPSFEKMKYMTEDISDRIWERTIDSKDFLQLRIGNGQSPSSYTVTLSSSDLANREIDDLLEQSQDLEKAYKEVGPVPIPVQLKDGAMGLIGKEKTVKKELHQLIGQLAFSHSYHDLRFVFIFDEDEYEDWQWMKWLPHFQLPHAYAKGMIYNEQTRDQLLSSLYELIRERDIQKDEKGIFFSPHIVFIVTNQQLIADHIILEYLESEHQKLGISAIFAAENKESLTEHIHTLIRYVNEKEGDILIQEKKAVQIPFNLDQHSLETNETFARTLRTLDHLTGMTNSIPNSVSFLGMFQAKEVDELPIEQNWLTRESAKSLAVPIGLKGKEDLVELNLHEKAHGPHGLLAGTTGSGKSEFLQTYILSLAAHFHPHEVAFLLIDYKGGGMAQPFKNMPHLLGTITNIEGSKNFSARALASIKSELKRRQRLFDQHTVNHINDYTKLYKKGEATDPLPHLFLISDEFAELKSEEPDFIRELVSAARIGRSLGVHLILATQKPGGVIDNQIWSNARFRVALKVQDATDSKEILKNADAAAITVTGRGYLQVGNNEVYELFQSAWSGAPYNEETREGEDEVALVTDLGFVPLSDVSASIEKKRDVQTEIDVVVEKIAETQKKLNIKKLPSPWLPPLEERISRIGHMSEQEGEIVMGIIDEPEKQSQTAFAYNMIDDGSIGIFGTSGYGKSVSAMTLLMGMASKMSPEELHVYIMDFGNGALLPLRQLPHTADYFLVDQSRKIEKFMSILKDELAKRKRLFQQHEVSSIKMYNNLSPEKLPVIFITIDNFDIIKDEMYDLETELNQILRDGQSLGIYMMITASRANAVRHSIMSNLKTKIAHYMLDSSELHAIVGRPQYAMEAIPGRAFIKKEHTYFAQMLLPADGANDYELLDQLKEDIQMLVEKYSSYTRPKPVPMLPTDLSTITFSQYIEGHQRPGIIPIGLHEEQVQPVHLNLLKNKHCLIIGQSQKGKTNVLKVVINTVMAQQEEKIALFDSIDRGLSSYATEEKIDYLESKESIAAWLDYVEALMTEREEQYMKAINEGKAGEVSFTPLLLVIDGYARFLQAADSLIQDRIVKFMKNFSHLGFNIIVAGSNAEISKGYDTLSSELKQIRQAIILMKKSEQTILTLPYDRKEVEINAGFGYYAENGRVTKIQIPLSAIERKIYS